MNDPATDHPDETALTDEQRAEMAVVIENTVKFMEKTGRAADIAPSIVLCGTLKAAAFFATEHRRDGDPDAFRKKLGVYFDEVLGLALEFWDSRKAKKGRLQ